MDWLIFISLGLSITALVVANQALDAVKGNDDADDEHTPNEDE